MNTVRTLFSCLILLSIVLMNGCGAEDLRYLEPNPLASDVSSPPPEALPFISITDEYEYLSITEENTYAESDRFRIYYSTPDSIKHYAPLSEEAPEDIELALEYLEGAYEYFVTDWGFRSPGLSIYSNMGPYFKLNIYALSKHKTGGKFESDARSGLGYIRTTQGDEEYERIISTPEILIHEFGHALTYSEYNWNSQNRTKAWWETLAEWVTDTYMSSSSYKKISNKWALTRYSNVFNPDVTLAHSYLTIVHESNQYEAWPFFTYLTENPDGIANLGKMVIPNLIREHRHNNETPLHVLERMISPVTVQFVLGRYWARMANLDLKFSENTLFNYQAFYDGDSLFEKDVSQNWVSLGEGEYKVLQYRAPMMGGANITRLKHTESIVEVQIETLENNYDQFAATLSIVDIVTKKVRYVTLDKGYAQINLNADEDVTLVVVNTPPLVLYDANNSLPGSPEQTGLNYKVKLTGAEPMYVHKPTLNQ